MENNVPTALEFFMKQKTCTNIEQFMIEFAKLHVEACKKDCYQKARLIHDGFDVIVDTDSILNAYPLTNIK